MKCLNCGTELIRQQQKYCCVQCQIEYHEKLYIQDWKDGKINGLSGEYQLSRYIRNYLLKKHNYKCELCGWGETNPYTNKIPLEIHHKDGDYKNNNENNLQVLCPNCHSLTATYRSANPNGRKGRKKYNLPRKQYLCKMCGKEITNKATYCTECNAKLHQKVDRPNREELKYLIRNFPFVQIGKKFGVTDNAIKKWCDVENLPRKKSDIKLYSDEEWALI